MKPIAVFVIVFAFAASVAAAPCPNSGPLPHELGTALESVRKILAAGRPAEALSRLDAALARTRNLRHPYPPLLRGQILLSMGRPAEAETALMEALKRDSCAEAGWRNLAAARHAQNRPGPAAEATERALRLSEDHDGELRYQAAGFHLAAGNPGRAIPHLERLVRRKRPRAEWLSSLGDAYEQAGRMENAADAYARAVRVGGSAENRYRAGRAWLTAGKPGKAAEALAPLASVEKGRAEWFLALGDAMERIGKKDRAADAFARAFQKTDDSDVGLRAAALWERAGQPETAAALLRALANRPDAKPEWRSDLARLLIRTGATDEAEALMAGDEGAAGAGSSTEMMEVRADWLLETERPTEALPPIRKLARQPDAAPKWRIALAEILLKTGERDAAVEAAGTVEWSGRHSLSPAEIHRLAAFWLRVDRPSEALSVLEAGMRAGDLVESHEFLRVRALGALERWEEAEAVLVRLRKNRPDDPAVWKLCARVGIQRERFREAAADLALAYRLSPPSREEWRRLGDLYARAGVYRKAAEAHERAFGDSPAAAELDLLARIWKQARDLDAARQAAESAAESEPTRERWATVGNLSLAMRDFMAARAAFVQAAELDDPDGEMSYWAGYAAWREGNFAAAKASLKRAMVRAEENGRIIAKARRLLEGMTETI